MIAIALGRAVSLTERAHRSRQREEQRRLAQIDDIGCAMALVARRVAMVIPDDAPAQIEGLRTAMAGPLGVVIDTLEQLRPHDTPAQLALRCGQLVQEALAIWAAREALSPPVGRDGI